MFREVLQDPVLRLFDRLSPGERLFVRGRLLTAPLRELERRVSSEARQVLEVGCGHGLLTGMLALGRAERRVVGIDPDVRKIDWAKRSVGALPNVELRAVGAEELLPEFEGAFDAIVIADVLYLLPQTRWAQLLRTCHRLLRPDGQLVLKEAEADRSWKHLKAVAQEVVMVHGLRRTRSSGGMTLLPRETVSAMLRDVGFEVREVKALRGYSTPHILYDARR